jgi:hypothetical protein
MNLHTENRKGVDIVLTGHGRVVPQRKSALLLTSENVAVPNEEIRFDL